ncbi:d5a8566e-ad84-46f8-a701-972ecfd2eeba [Sclerotinia trifoliorum]|uniref:D5a8566e-ad84-46f8-a701-972ecfd2eeba n=1 Tax=Sclerotinia trifoliorum TaxID=28548 RepID=A0A8H2VVX7_9HELO|nr:d5a8566e-ad84-46f8-a701-972ecfd2eeba [Sclerotinia trifoliorum]
MSVEIDLQELGFHRPFTSEVSQTLRIRNPNLTPVGFKVKTTAPKQYCVRPNSGKLEPGRSIDVTVLLQAMKEEPPLDAKCRDKFLVQSVEITPDKEFVDSPSNHVDRAEKKDIQEKKIRVVFLPPKIAGEATVTPLRNGVSSNSIPDTAPPAYRSPSPEEDFTPATNRVVSGGSGPSASVSVSDEPVGNRNLGDARSSTFDPATNSNAADTAPTGIPATVEELQAQLAEAKKTIASYAEQGGLRMRKLANGETSNETVNEVATKLQGVDGVPVQIVAALCFFSFLLAYLFF